MSNIYGRQVVLPLANKSGGGVVAGDVVIIDTGNDGAFTTTTTGAFGGSVGVAQETIANNATGRVLVSGYAALVNVPSSQTRGHYIKTHTVAKQATGASSRAAGMFGQLLTGGSTPTAWLWGMTDNAGAAAETLATSTLWAAQGDIVVATGDDAAAVLTKGATGTVPTAGASTLAYAYPPGYEMAYVEFTSPVAITATTEATANSVVSAGAVTFDGSTIVVVAFGTDYVFPPSGVVMRAWLYDGSSSIGELGVWRWTDGSGPLAPTFVQRRLTPSAGSHTYSVRFSVASGTGEVDAGAGGAGTPFPGYIRITKV